MKKFKISILVILLNVLMIKSIEACDLLSVNIGGDKSTLNFIEIEDEDIDFGNVILKTYISGNIIGAVEIKVQNGTDNEESKKGLIKGYAERNFGNLDMESELWNGYKIWDIGSKQIYYYAYESKNQPTDEGIVVTSKKYYDVLLHDNYE